MKLIVFCLSIFFVSAFAFSAPAYAFEKKPGDIKIIADGAVLNVSDRCETVGRTVHIPLREVCEALGADVRWDSRNGLAVVLYKSKVYAPETVLIKNKAYMKPEVLEGIFDCYVENMYSINVIAVYPKGGELSVGDLMRILPEYSYYSREDLRWLAQIVHAEANGESYESKLAVANVVLNRVASPIYPNTVKGVIFDKKSGVQFTPAANGSIYNTPAPDSCLAAIEALEGNNNANKALFFINPKIAKSSWVSRNRELAFVIGNHNFYN